MHLVFDMEDFNAVAVALSGAIGKLRACLILSRDGFVVGAHPATAERDVKHIWVRLAALGEVERGFVQLATEMWCYVRRGPYAAFAVASATVRPGLVMDQMEEALLRAEQARADREWLTPSGPAGTPVIRPRSPLHPEPIPPDRPLVLERAPAEAAAPRPASGPEQPLAVPGSPEIDPPPKASSQAFDDPTGLESPPKIDEGGAEAEPVGGPDQDGVDPVTLAREFFALLQDDRDPADG